MEERKFDPRMLLPLLLVPLLVPVVMIARFRRKRRKARELAAARALARRLEAERQAGKGKAKKVKGGKKSAGKAKEVPETGEEKKKAGFFAKKGAAYRKRLIRFLIMLGIERLVAARRAQMEEEFLNNSLLRRFSKAKDI